MKTYVVTGRSVSIHEGAVVALTKEQAHERRYFVELLEGDCYLAIRRFEFKRGERFGADGEFPKALAEAVVAESGPSLREEPASEATPLAPSPDYRKGRPRR